MANFHHFSWFVLVWAGVHNLSSLLSLRWLLHSINLMIWTYHNKMQMTGLWGRGRGRFWWCPTHVGGVWVTVTIVTMTIVGAILPPMVVFTTGSAEQLWGNLCLGFCSGDMNWFCANIAEMEGCVYYYSWEPSLPRPLVRWLVNICYLKLWDQLYWVHFLDSEMEFWPLVIFVLVVGACAPCVPLSGPSVSPCKWFSTDWLGSYGDDLPSCCVSAPCGTKEFFINMSSSMSGCWHWISRIGRLCRGLLFSKDGDWLYLNYNPCQFMLSTFLILEKEVLFMWGFFPAWTHDELL